MIAFECVMIVTGMALTCCALAIIIRALKGGE